MHVRFFQIALGARPQLTLEGHGVLLVRPLSDARNERTPSFESHGSGGPTWCSWRRMAWSTSRWHSSSNLMPAARAASGISESSVCVGTVFNYRSHDVQGASTLRSTSHITDQPNA